MDSLRPRDGFGGFAGLGDFGVFFDFFRFTVPSRDGWNKLAIVAVEARLVEMAVARFDG